MQWRRCLTCALNSLNGLGRRDACPTVEIKISQTHGVLTLAYDDILHYVIAGLGILI